MRRLAVSLLLLLTLAWASPGLDRLADAKTPEEAAKAARALPDSKNPAVQKARETFLADPKDEDAKKAFLGQLRIEEALRQAGATPVNVDAAKAKQDRGVLDLADRQESNWLQRGVRAFGEWLGSLFNPRPAEMNAPNLPAFTLPDFLTPLMWGLLAVAIAIGLYFVARHLRFHRGEARRKHKGGLLDDDEPLLSSDEWLARGDQLIRDGEYRLAARCFYLAILMRLDQVNVLPFVRTDTNWEHYRRYTPTEPLRAFDLLEPTRHFDVVWYDGKPVLQPEAVWFRERYAQLLQFIEGRAA